MTTNTKAGFGKDIFVYLFILGLAAIQFVIAFQNMDASQMLVWMLIVASIEAAVALLFFMHLSDNRGLMFFVVIFAVGALLAMQYGWTDSFRILNGAPWAGTK
jgi:heme/copper-type cytochrome/quinol oxidase subunit 4